MANKIVRKTFISTMIVFILNNIVTTIGTIVDGIVISRLLSENAMAAYGIVSPILFVVAAVGVIFSTGSQILISKSMGSGDIEKANKLFSLMIFLVSIISFSIVGIILAIQNPLLNLLGVNDILFEPAKGYLIGLALGIPGILFVTCLSPLLQLDRDGVRGVIAIIAMTAINITCDFLNAYVLKWGTFGMGLGTSISYYVALVVILFHFRKGKTFFKLSSFKKNWKSALEMVKLGLPTAIKCASNTFRIALLNIILLSVASVTSVTVLSIQLNLSSLFSSIGLGVGTSAMMITSVYIGEKDKEAIKAVFKIALTIGLAVSAVFSILLFVFAPQITLIYTKFGTDVYYESIKCLRFYAPYVIIYTLSSLFIAVSQSFGHLFISYMLNALDLFIYPVFFAFLLSRFFAQDGVWMCFAIGGLFTLITIFVISSVKSKKIAYKIDRFILLPKSLDISEDDTFSASIDNIDGTIKASKDAYQFCATKSDDKNKSYFLSLFIEEMCTYIINNCFEDKKTHSIDLRVVKEENQFIVRIRDDCKSIDFKNKVKMSKQIENDSLLGIKMVMKCASDVKFTRTVNTNNVFIVV